MPHLQKMLPGLAAGVDSREKSQRRDGRAFSSPPQRLFNRKSTATEDMMPLLGGGDPLEDNRCYQGLGNTADRNYLEIMPYPWKLCSEMR